ncbi:MAG: (2Fe-2S)-binding protein [Pseudomonadales bacterium]|nr:(2Fe-2S)-binding protein [Pseudomonadales bacterium]
MPQTINIDKQNIPFSEGQSIIEAAEQAGVYIPHLCHKAGYKAHGSCRLCTVTVNGRWVSACTEPAEAHQQVENNTRELQSQRRAIVQLLFAEGNHHCPFCEKSGNCQLQAVAYSLDMHDTHFAHQLPQRSLDASHPDVLLDRDRCIQCELCVRASQEYDKKNVFALSGRGPSTQLIINSESGKLKDSQINKNDEAIKVCPTGALMNRSKPFSIPIGQRQFDKIPIDQQNTCVPDTTEAST